MSIDDPKSILNRIMVASQDSPIAVFKTAEEGCLEALFADTAGTRKRVSSGLNLVGLFDQNMNISTTYNILLKYSKDAVDYNV